MVFDPFAYGALAVYLGTIGAVALGLVALAWLRRGGAWTAVEAACKQAVQMGATTFAPLPDGGFLVYGAEASAARVSGGAAPQLQKVTRVALVKDMDGQTGLVVTAGGQNVCVSGIGPMAHVYGQAQRDGAEMSIVFRDDEAERMSRLIGLLDGKEREILAGWLTEKEVLTDIIFGVDYEGQLRTAGAKGKAKLLVTNLRAGLLGTTIQTEHLGNATRTTTHYSLISYLLPLAEKVTVRRASGLGANSYVLELALKPEHQNEGAPKLKLTEDHAGVFLPLVLFRCPVEVVEEPVGVGNVIGGAILGGIGWGILTAIVGVVVAVALTEGSDLRHWGYRYTLPIVLGAALTPLVFRISSLLRDYLERAREQGLRAAIAKA